MSHILRPQSLKHESKFIPQAKMKAHKEAQAKRVAQRPGYQVRKLHTDFANDKLPSVEQIKYACREYEEQTQRRPDTLYTPRALVKWCIFYEDGVKTELLVKEWKEPDWQVCYEGKD